MVNDASNVTFDGINVDAGGVKTAGAAFELGGSSVTVKNAEIGNVVDEKAMLATGANHTVDNVTFHDAIFRTDGHAHGVPVRDRRAGLHAAQLAVPRLRGDGRVLHVRVVVVAAAAGLRQRDDREQRVRPVRA